MARRVEDRSAAAEAALEMLAHARRPVLSRVTLELGTGVDNTFPRRPVDVVEGEVLEVVGRVREAAPSSIVVRGTVAGAEFEETITISTGPAPEGHDLRLRWARERLNQLLLAGASREEIAELGTRYGLLTPQTSFYVPSARELRQMGVLARALEQAPLLSPTARAEFFVEPQDVLAFALGPLALAGCTMSAEPSSQSGPRPEGVAAPQPVMPAQASGSAASTTETASPATTVPMAPPSVVAAAEPTDEPAADFAEAEDRSASAGPTGGALLGSRLDAEESIGLGDIGAIGRGAGGGGTGAGYGSGGAVTGDYERSGEEAPSRARRRAAAPAPSAARPAPTPRPVQRGLDDWNDQRDVSERQVGTTRITTIIRTTTSVADHRAQRCSDAARLSLDDRRSLWRERLSSSSGVYAFVQVYRRARDDCETPSWRDRRAFMSLMLNQAGSIQQMLALYHALGGGSDASYVRSAILRRVRTADDLRAVRNSLGLGASMDTGLIEQILERATTPAARLRALRQLVRERPENFELALRLLHELERQRQTPELLRLASRLRLDPLSDSTVRTEIGETYLRMDREDDARRTFSEIVEFAPLDELARRRLGDLYRAHGWYDGAYRQYATLASIRPDDPSVLLLLAQAAAGAGRVDEALRLEQRLMETAAPGMVGGMARVAQLWSSVRYAQLRKAAREANDEDRLAALTARMRRSGVLREAPSLRVALTWAHPDAQLSLWAAHPSLSLTRPPDLAPEFGIEAFDVAEQEAGQTYRIEVRRAAGDSLGALEGNLIILWNEGQRDELISIIPISLSAGQTLELTLRDRDTTNRVREPAATSSRARGQQ